MNRRKTSNHKKETKDKYNHIIDGLIIIGISALVLLILSGVFDPSGRFIREFLIGSFGLSVYGITVGALLIGVLRMLKYRINVSYIRVLQVVMIYSLFILAFHATTSNKYIEISSGFSSYIANCFEATDTAGGVIAAVVMYPLLKFNYIFALVLISLALFAVIGWALLGGKINLGGVRTRSIRFRKQKDRPQEESHVVIDNKLKNEDIEGNQLKDIKQRSRFSKKVVEYTPIEEEEDFQDNEFVVDYKDRYAFDSSNATVMEDGSYEIDNDKTEPEETSKESEFERIRNEARKKREAAELLYGKGDKKSDDNKDDSLKTDTEKFRAAIDRIRNNEEPSFYSKISSNEQDYELYSTDGREKVYRENLEKERLKKLEEDVSSEDKKDVVNDNNGDDVSYVSHDFTAVGHDTTPIPQEDDSTVKDDYVNDISVDDTDSNSYKFDNFSAILDDVDKEVGLSGYNDNNHISDDNKDEYKEDNKDEMSFDSLRELDRKIDDFGEDKDKDDVIKKDEISDNSSIIDEYTKSESEDLTVNNEISGYDDSLNKEFRIEKKQDTKYTNPIGFGKREEKSSDRVDEIERELMDFDKKDSDETRKRRSDFGGKHNSSRADDNVLPEVSKDKAMNDARPASEDIKSTDSNDSANEVAEDVTEFINPFKKLEEARAAQQQTVEEKAPAVDPQKDKPYLMKSTKPYKAPPISLLKDFEFKEEPDEGIDEQCNLIEENLKTFGIHAKVKSVVKGPTFSRIELMMEQGTGKSVKTIKNLAPDIEMWLGCKGHVNILAPIPGKTTIGIELPNKVRRTVGLKEVFNSKEFNNPKIKIPFALGVDIDNIAHVCDITKTPHLLIAGSTGSGKSVGIAALLNSILYKCSPDEVKLILIDPKKVELNDYRELPHMLLKNSVTEPKQVINVLNWLIDEMERRYNALCEVHTSKIEEYNEIMDAKKAPRMPYIVLVIDEVADLMIELKKNLEDRINKLAAKSRAAGIHIVLATQRPSVDIITGAIKANLPSRIAYATVQQEDSRTILGAIGAERLLRDGDMLYMSATSPMLDRIQGAFISKSEVVSITDYVRENNEAEFNDGIQKFIDKVEEESEEDTSSLQQPNAQGGNNAGAMALDERFIEALDTVITANNASISMIQRKLGVGYPRAGKIHDQLEKYKYIAGNKVLITRAQFEKLFNNDGDNA